MRVIARMTLVAVVASWMAGAAAARPIDETVAADADGTVKLSNVAGSVKIRGTNAREVHVTGTADDKVKEVSVESRNGDVEIEVELEDKIRGHGGEADLVVDVPKGARIEIETVSAPIDVEGVEGEIALESVSGDLDVRVTKAAAADLETVSGSIRVEGRLPRLQAESVSGALTIRGVSGPIDAETTSGAIEIEGSGVEKVDCSSVSGSLSFAGSPAKDALLSFENFSGSVLLELPANVDAEVDVETFSGSVESDFGGEVERPRFGPGASLEQTLGKGSAEVSISTFSGSVELRKANRGRRD